MLDFQLPASPASTAPPNSSSTANKPAPTAALSLNIYAPDKTKIGEVGAGNRKDIRNAVEAARAAANGWAKSTGHNRAQIIYYLAENLAARADEFARRISQQTGATSATAMRKLKHPSTNSSPPPPGPTNTTAASTACRNATSPSR